MSKLKPVAELLKATGQAIGNAFRGPLPQPRPAPPSIPRPEPSGPLPAPPLPRPAPASPQPRRPVFSPEAHAGPRAEPEPLAEPDPEAEGQTETDNASKAKNEQQCEPCTECVARDIGTLADRPAPQAPPATKRGYDYQHFVCPWHWYTPTTARIGEWNFMGVDFDGLHMADCHLYEAKHGYDGFLRQDDWSSEGRPKVQDWVERSQKATVFEVILDQARRQVAVVAPHYPDVRLTWVFSSMMTKLYVFEIFLNRRMVPPIDAEVRPFMQGGYDE